MDCSKQRSRIRNSTRGPTLEGAMKQFEIGDYVWCFDKQNEENPHIEEVVLVHNDHIAVKYGFTRIAYWKGEVTKATDSEIAWWILTNHEI